MKNFYWKGLFFVACCLWMSNVFGQRLRQGKDDILNRKRITSKTFVEKSQNNLTTKIYTRQSTTLSTRLTCANPPVIYAYGTNPTCASSCDGKATVDVVGGTAPYTYSWSNGGSTKTINNLCPGNYSVVVTDSLGCTSSNTAVTVPGCFQIQSILIDACSATEWEQEMVFFQVGSAPLSTSSLTVKWATAANSWQGLCSNPTFINNTNATITGGGKLIAVAPGGTIPANANAVLITGNTLSVSANSFANLTDTLYVLFQCSGNTAGHFSNYSASTTSRTLIMNFSPNCRDTVTYNPSLLVTTAGTSAAEDGATVNFSATGTATYLNNGCIIPYTIQNASVNLTSSTPSDTPYFNQVQPICSGDLLNALPTTSINGITGSWTPAINNTATTTYTFTPDTGQCAFSTSMTITVNQATVPVFNQIPPICIGDSISLPTTSANGITGSWSPAINNQATTTYLFIPTAGQCADSTSMTVTVGNSTLPIFSQVPPVCRGEIIVLPTTSTNGITGSWSPAINNTATTTYIFIPDSGQCASTSNMTIVVNQPTTPQFNQIDPICAGDNILLPNTANNGINGSWSPAINNTATTIYTFTPDSGQCASTTTMTIVVTQPTTPQFNQIAPICAGDNILLPTTSNNGINGSWSPAINNSATTTYTFNPDSGQCASTSSMTIVVNQPTTPPFNQIAPICAGDNILLPNTSNNGINGSWSPAINNTATTTYTFIPDSGQCATLTSMTIVVNETSYNSINIDICQGESYLFNGNNYSDSGTYFISLINSNGCDSIISLNITLKPTSVSFIEISICENQLPYTWNGILFTQANTQTITLTNSVGCDSLATLQLKVNANTQSTNTLSVCASQIPYNWNGLVYQQAGTQTAVLTNSSGCDSLAILHLDILSNSNKYYDTVVCSKDLPFIWNGKSFSAAALDSVIFTGQNGCDSIEYLTLAVKSCDPPCSSETFSSANNGWRLKQGARIFNYQNPANQCSKDTGIITPGVGGYNPAHIRTPDYISSGAGSIDISFDIYCMDANLKCNSWKDYDCTTSVDLYYYAGNNRYEGLRDHILPPNGPANSPTVTIGFPVGNNLPAGTTYSIEIIFKFKSGIGNCIQQNTKYILDNFDICEKTCANCGSPQSKQAKSSFQNQKANETEAQNLSIFPVPASDRLTLSGIAANPVTLDIVDMSGNIVLRTSNSKQLNISRLKSGHYFLKVIYADKIIIKQFQKI